MRLFLILILILSKLSSIQAASAYWTGITIDRMDIYHSDNKSYDISGMVYSENNKRGSLTAILFGHTEGESYLLKSYDYSVTSAPVKNSWIVAYYGQILGPATIDEANFIEMCGYGNCYNGGTLIDDPTNFYLAFTTSEFGVENGQTWYGWAHVSIDHEKNMNILASGIGLYGEAITVGVSTPEPSCALLLLIGIGVLGLRRRPTA